MKKLETLIFRTVLLTFFVFPFWNAAGNVLFGICCLFSLLYLIKNGTKILDKNILFWMYLGLFAVYFLNEILFGDIFQNFLDFGFWLGVPLVFCGFQWTKNRKKQLLTALNWGGFVMILITFFLAFLEQSMAFNEKILRQHQTIYCYFLCINLLTSLKLSEPKTPIVPKIIFGINGIFSILLLFLIGSRMPIIICIFIGSSYFFYEMFIKKAKDIFSKIKLLTILFSMFLGIFHLVLALVAPFKNKKNENLIPSNGKRLQSTFDKKQNKRIYIYKAVFEVFARKDFDFLTGYHTDLKSRNILKFHLTSQNKMLKKKGYKILLDTNFRTHNDFLEHFLNYGILGLSLFFSSFVVVFRRAFLQKKFDLWACGLLLFFACLTDNAFLMQASLFIFLSLAVLLFRNFDAKRNKKFS